MDVSIIGGSGYAGGELLRILLQHPKVNLRQVTSRRYAGQPVSVCHPNLRSFKPLLFSKTEDVEPCDMLYLCLPNGESMGSMKHWTQKADKIIDCGADFRLRSPEEWNGWYGTDHACPNLLSSFVYGVPELYRDRIRTAKNVAGPGCEAIVSILTLYPFVKNGMIRKDPIIIDAKMGSSQAGNKASSSSHHPERVGVVRPYKPVGHRHAAEIEQTMGDFSTGIQVNISATAVEMVRGVSVTIHTYLKDDSWTEKDAWKVLRKEYANEPFIRIVKMTQGLYRFPEPKILQGTNYCEIGFEKETRGNRLVLLGAIDNLVKGTAGNAVQCMNLMSGFPETLGLEFPGLHP